MASAQELAQHLYDFLLPHIASSDEAALANQPRDRIPSVFTSQSLQPAACRVVLPPQQSLLRPPHALHPPRTLLHPPQAAEPLQHPPHAVHYPPHAALPPPPLASHLPPTLYSWAGSSLFPSDNDFLPPPVACHPSPSYPAQSDLPLCSSGPIAQSLPPPLSKPARPLLSRSSRASVHQDLLMDMESAFERSNDSINPKQLHRILKRRQERAMRKQFRPTEKRKKYLHESRHKHAMNRVRGEKGRFVTVEKNPEATIDEASPCPQKDSTLQG